SAQSLKGIEPSSLTYDATRKRLYATQAGLNAVGAYDVDLGKDPPVVAPSGRLPTQWWPSGVATLGDGTLVVTSLMARGVGAQNPLQAEHLHKGRDQRVTKT